MKLLFYPLNAMVTVYIVFRVIGRYGLTRKTFKEIKREYKASWVI